MSDETRPDEPGTQPADEASDDHRDAEIAALLAVAPLDDVTRRRLVHRAISTAYPSQRGRLAGIASIAAAIVVGIAIGAILVHHPDVPGPTTAIGNPTLTAAAPKAAADAPAIAVAPGSITALGNLGDVSTDDSLRSSVAGAEERAATANQDASQAPCASTNPTSIGLVAIVRAGVGDSNGQPVAVLIGTAPDGTALAVVVQQPDCSLLRTVTLPD